MDSDEYNPDVSTTSEHYQNNNSDKTMKIKKEKGNGGGGENEDNFILQSSGYISTCEENTTTEDSSQDDEKYSKMIEYNKQKYKDVEKYKLRKGNEQYIGSDMIESTSQQVFTTTTKIKDDLKIEQPSTMNQASTTTSLRTTYKESQFSSIKEEEQQQKNDQNQTAGLSSPTLNPSVVLQPLDSVANGTIPKSGKPLMAATNKKLNKPRGRPKRSKALVAMYQSEISDNTVGIKLCIKKSDTTQTKAKNRKRSRKSKHRGDDSEDEGEYKKRRRKEKANNNTDKHKKNDKDYKEPVEQSVWGNAIPEEILYNIFGKVVQEEGCLPTLFRLGRVCTLWRKVSLSPSLWRNLDLSAWIKEKHRTELKLKWLIDNRLSGCTELNISNWKVSDIQCVLDKLADACPGLIGITLAGWKGFTSDHLIFLVEEFKKLERLDLSSINVEMNPSKSAIGLQSLCNAIQAINGRLTHLHLAHNRLAGIPQIISTLATYCPNLLLLDLSNVRTLAISHGILHIERLQHGCQKLKILRITNSHITLSAASLQEQLDSPGFPELEELSVASLADESRVINDDFLQRILKKSTKLKLLDVRGCARLTHDSLIRLPAWDLKHLFLSGCSVTRDLGSGLELIASKWAHSLIEFDLAWANVQESLDNALRVLAEKGSESPLIYLNLCGSSVSEDAVKEILTNCPLLNSINLSSCRGLPRGVKRLMHGPAKIQELRDVLKVQLKVKSVISENN